MDYMDTDKDHICGLWKKDNLYGKTEVDIKTKVKGKQAIFDAAVSECTVTKPALVLGPMH